MHAYAFSESDIGIATCALSILTKYSFPYKIPEYMASGLPVIITNMGEIKRMINKSKAGVTVNQMKKNLLK